MSITSLPCVRPAATPSSANSTLATSGVSGTMMMTTSAACATAVELATTVAVLLRSSGTGYAPFTNSV